MSDTLDSSCDGDEIADLTSVIAEFPEGDDNPDKIPIRKLLDTFENIAKTDQSLKVYLRVRPVLDGVENTIKIINDNTILTNAPDSSNRARFTKLEERLYVTI